MVPRRGAVRGLAACFGAAVALLCASCSGSKNVSVKGQVLYQGKPIEGAVVTFHPKGGDDLKAHHPSGLTDKDGNFTLSTPAGEGAPVGDYVVTVNWYRPVEQAAAKKAVISTEMPAAPPDYFKGKPYASRDHTKLEAKITPDTKTLEPFRLE